MNSNLFFENLGEYGGAIRITAYAPITMNLYNTIICNNIATQGSSCLVCQDNTGYTTFTMSGGYLLVYILKVPMWTYLMYNLVL